MSAHTLTQARLKELLDYDPETGVFTWKKITSRRVRVGAVAGYISPNGYRQIRIDGQLYMSHRLVFVFVHGTSGEDEVDHINGRRDDNRACNLRIVGSDTEQNRNLCRKRSNTSGHNGVSIHKGTGKWLAQITVDYKAISLGLFTEIEDAVSARKAAEVKYGFHPNHGRDPVR